MKNLANCKPSEFLKQTNRIRKAVSKWLTATDIVSIRKRVPDTTGMTQEEKDEVYIKQIGQNAAEILDVILDKYPDETLEMLALFCFVEPKHVDDYTVQEYLTAFTELMNNKAVLNFFTSLMRLANQVT